MNELVVSKFGGTSVGDAEAIGRCTEYLAENDGSPRIAVVSAIGATTDRLKALADLTAGGFEDRAASEVSAIIDDHRSLASFWEWDAESQERFEERLAFLRKWVTGMVLLDGGSPDAVDRLLSIGEDLSALMLTRALISRGVAAVYCDVRDVLRTDDHYGSAHPDVDATRTLARRFWVPVLERGSVIVTQGFIGTSAAGKTTTLGRGGSDFTAALLAEALEARQVEIWTDVPGVATTDPRLLPNAEVLDEISFAEAAELAVFGARVLHPKTLWPAVRKGIPVFVGSSRTFSPNGTRIVPHLNAPVSGPRAVALRRDQRLVTLTSLRMLHAAGYLSRVFDILSRYNISVDMVTTSEISVALTLDNPADFSNAIQSELQTIATVQVETDLALLSVVGNELTRVPGMTETLCRELEDIPIRMICQGASDHSLGLLVSNGDADEALRRLHAVCLRNGTVTV